MYNIVTDTQCLEAQHVCICLQNNPKSEVKPDKKSPVGAAGCHDCDSGIGAGTEMNGDIQGMARAVRNVSDVVEQIMITTGYMVCGACYIMESHLVNMIIFDLGNNHIEMFPYQKLRKYYYSKKDNFKLHILLFFWRYACTSEFEYGSHACTSGFENGRHACTSGFEYGRHACTSGSENGSHACTSGFKYGRHACTSGFEYGRHACT